MLGTVLGLSIENDPADSSYSVNRRRVASALWSSKILCDWRPAGSAWRRPRYATCRPGLDGSERSEQPAARGDDVGVAGDEMLARAVADRARRLSREGVLRRVIVPHAAEGSCLHQLAVLQIAAPIVAAVAILDQSGHEILLIALPRGRPGPIEDEVEADVVIVIDRNMPVDRIAFTDPSLTADRYDLARHE